MIYYNVNKRKNPQTGAEKFYGTLNFQSVFTHAGIDNHVLS